MELARVALPTRILAAGDDALYVVALRDQRGDEIEERLVALAARHATGQQQEAMRRRIEFHVDHIVDADRAESLQLPRSHSPSPIRNRRFPGALLRGSGAREAGQPVMRP